jgi:hypothetical protein
MKTECELAHQERSKMRKRFRIRQAVLQLLVSCAQLKFTCQAALLPSALLPAVHQRALDSSSK